MNEWPKESVKRKDSDIIHEFIIILASCDIQSSIYSVSQPTLCNPLNARLRCH